MLFYTAYFNFVLNCSSNDSISNIERVYFSFTTNNVRRIELNESNRKSKMLDWRLFAGLVRGRVEYANVSTVGKL